MALFPVHRFIPSLARPVAVAVPPKGDGLFSRFWVRRAVPTTGGQNYSLGSQELPRFMLSGPFDYNARQFRPLEKPLPNGAQAQRVLSSNAYATGMATGQWWQAPLVGPDGGVTKALIPVNNRPFNINGILPAGKA